MKKILLALLLVFTVSGFSQLSKTHYIPPLSNSTVVMPKLQFMYISTPSSTPVKFKIIKVGGGFPILGVVSRTSPYSLDIGVGQNTQLIVNKYDVGNIMSNKGFIVEADDLVYVNVRVTDDQDNHAGSVVSKGMAALGKEFRIGAFTNKLVQSNISAAHYTFASIMATENNTIVSFADIKPGVVLINNESVGSFLSQKTLNRGESYVIAVDGSAQNNFNRDGLIGASITSNKPIAVNCGSFGGSNGDANNLDLGFDQIVPAERTGMEYIFVRGNGTAQTECPIIIANEDNTQIFLDGSTVPFTTLMKGKYIPIDGNRFSSNGNLYVRGSKNFFAYQGLGGTNIQANQNMHFMPPLSCETPKVIDNIPFINEIGSKKDFIGTVNIVTETNAVLNFKINENPYTLSNLPGSVTVKGPSAVIGNPRYVTYSLTGLTGNVSVTSTKQVYLSYFGSSGNATYGGYYSGFIYKPEVVLGKLNADSAYCLPNVKLSVNNLSLFEEFQWYFNGNLISGATNNSYEPQEPGLYKVVANMKDCTILRTSDEIAVSLCLDDSDSDGVNDYVDIDIDNDGIVNCEESIGDIDLDLSVDAGVISKADYSNSYTKEITIVGKSYSYAEGYEGGVIKSQIVAGVANSLTQTFNFTKPISLTLEYVESAGETNWLNADGDFVLEVPSGKTILVLNPDDQLLIDTNYDGIYESGVKEYSSFQIRFRLKNGIKPLEPGTGTFKFLTRLVNTLSLTHKNLSETKSNNAIFKLSATCVPKDTDGDGIVDEQDVDDDNDGIPTLVEAMGKDYVSSEFSDGNKNGMCDEYDSGIKAVDSDNDGVLNYLDLDSDNDGIFDLTEAGFFAVDVDNDGMIDPGKGPVVFNLASVNVDSDGYQNYIDSDSDGDGCVDVIEAGFTDADADGYLGSSPVIVDSKGKITSATNGYTALSNNNYLISSVIIITNPLGDKTACISESSSFTISSNADDFQWQIAESEDNFVDIVDNSQYSGSKTTTLQINNVTLSMNGFKYRVVLNKNGNSCGLISSDATLQVVSNPTVMAGVSFEKCDYDSDGLTDFNLKQKESQISSNYTNETFTYFTSLTAAQTNDESFKIANPTTYNNSKGNTVWVRVENANGCFAVSQIDLSISITQIQLGKVWKLSQCDDYINSTNDDKDGVSTFDFQSVTNEIIASLPANATYTVKYYKSENDAVSEANVISNVNAYRNVGSPNFQTIWVRISSNTGSSCDGIGAYLELTVNPIPDVELKHNDPLCYGKNNSVTINAGLLSGSQTDYTYTWFQDGQSLSATQYNLDVTTEGVYTCIIKDIKSGCENTRTNTVFYSKIAQIEKVTIHDLADNNKVIVTTVEPGDYEYSLDKEFGPFQDSNVFENVEPGIHDVYVNDKNGCGVVSENISVVGAPAFFTPNGDGVNENWNVKGVNSLLNKNSKIDIFDRFGKLVYVITDLESDGWDGTYNGSHLPSTDYWYVVYFGNGRQGKGHFALKR